MPTETTPLLERIASGRTDLIFDYLACARMPSCACSCTAASASARSAPACANTSRANTTSLGHTMIRKVFLSKI
jgi:hypothetical protein